MEAIIAVYCISVFSNAKVQAPNKGLFDRAPLEEPEPKRLRLICFLLQNSFSRKTFGMTSLEEPESEPERTLSNRP
jgi:hypothetical protein